MPARVMERLSREPTPHTEWCAGDHRCGVDVHQSPDIRADHLGGRAFMTRVRAGAVEYAEIRIRVPLSPREATARRQLATALQLIRELLVRVVARPGAVSGVVRPELERRRSR